MGSPADESVEGGQTSEHRYLRRKSHRRLGNARSYRSQACQPCTASPVALLLRTLSVALPGDEGWTSNPYADRPAADTRPSGADLTAAVTDRPGILAGAVTAAKCEDREQAAEIVDDACACTASADGLAADVTSLLVDFAVSPTEEKARVAAEVEAARIAAEQKAARPAAEAEAAARAPRKRKPRGRRPHSANPRRRRPRRAPEAAARAAAVPARAAVRLRVAQALRGRPRMSPPSGGGGTGFGDNGGVYWTSDGTGGLKPCGT